MLTVGDKVQRLRPGDGTSLGHKPYGPTLTVLSIEDHRPVDGPMERNAVVRLSDGDWSFPWRLAKVENN